MHQHSASILACALAGSGPGCHPVLIYCFSSLGRTLTSWLDGTSLDAVNIGGIRLEVLVL